MNHSYSIEKNNVSLVPMTLIDSQKYREHRNLERNRKWFLNNRFINENAQMLWYKNYLLDESDYMFAIYFRGEFIGGNGIYHINISDKSAEYGRLLVADHGRRGCGVGTIATELACVTAKDLIKLKTLYLEVYRNNFAAIHCYEKVGFSCDTFDDKCLHMSLSL